MCYTVRVHDVLEYRTSVRALGFEPVLHMYYDDTSSPPRGVIVDVVVGFDAVFEEYSLGKIAQTEGGILVRQDDGSNPKDYCSDPDQIENVEPLELIEWVTPNTTYTRKEGLFVSRYDTTQMNWAYGDLYDRVAPLQDVVDGFEASILDQIAVLQPKCKRAAICHEFWVLK